MKASTDPQQGASEAFSRRGLFEIGGWAGLTLAAGGLYIGALRSLLFGTHTASVADIEGQPNLYVGKKISVACSLERIGQGRLEWTQEVVLPVVRPPDAFALPARIKSSEEVTVFSIREAKRSDLVVVACPKAEPDLASNGGRTTQLVGELVCGSLDGRDVFALRLLENPPS